MGYKFQFVTLAGFHSLNLGMFDLARTYKNEGMAAYAASRTKSSSTKREVATWLRRTSASWEPATST